MHSRFLIFYFWLQFCNRQSSSSSLLLILLLLLQHVVVRRRNRNKFYRALAKIHYFIKNKFHENINNTREMHYKIIQANIHISHSHVPTTHNICTCTRSARYYSIIFCISFFLLGSAAQCEARVRFVQFFLVCKHNINNFPPVVRWLRLILCANELYVVWWLAADFWQSVHIIAKCARMECASNKEKDTVLRSHAVYPLTVLIRVLVLSLSSSS